MAAKPVDPDTSRLSNLGAHAQKLVREFVALPKSERSRATELVVELEHVISEFKRLRPPPLFKTTVLKTVEAGNPRKCSICEKPVPPASWNCFETEGAVYHRTCYSGAVEPAS